MMRREFISLLGGAAVALPLAARAQQAARNPVPSIGFLSSRAPNTEAHLVAAFLRGLKDQGYVEGQNVTVEYSWAEGRYEQLPALAADLVRRQVAVLVTAAAWSAEPWFRQ
jgi:putative tryptophan/tyrosine transport system substrate-binding protein